MNRWLAIRVLILLKLLIVFVSYFYPFSLPHSVRQIDTLAVTFRYWHRWTLENDFSLLPAVLNSGDGRGIQAMEFPLLNVLLAPNFFFGLEAGRVMARFSLLALVIALLFWAYSLWRDQKIMNVEVRAGFPLLFLTSISSFYFYRYMPDMLAFVLTLVAMGVLLQQNRSKYFFGFILASLAMLIKPPVVVSFAPLLIMLRPKELSKQIGFSLGPAFIVTILYYTLGAEYLRSLSNLDPYFATSLRNPIETLSEFMMAWREQLVFYVKDFSGRYLSFIFLAYWLKECWCHKKIMIHPLFYLLLLQLLAVVLMGGKPTLIHDYYFIGTSLIMIIFAYRFLQLASKPWVAVFLFVVLGAIIDRGVNELRPVLSFNSWAQCSELKKSNPQFPWGQNHVFSSSDGSFPEAGLCFGERVGGTSKFYLETQNKNVRAQMKN